MPSRLERHRVVPHATGYCFFGELPLWLEPDYNIMLWCNLLTLPLLQIPTRAPHNSLTDRRHCAISRRW
jgi:hypothetical protein